MEAMPIKAVMLILIFLPIVAALVPVLALHRWAVNMESRGRQNFSSAWVRVRLPLVLLFLAGAIGAFSLPTSTVSPFPVE